MFLRNLQLLAIGFTASAAANCQLDPFLALPLSETTDSDSDSPQDHPSSASPNSTSPSVSEESDLSSSEDTISSSGTTDSEENESETNGSAETSTEPESSTSQEDTSSQDPSSDSTTDINETSSTNTGETETEGSEETEESGESEDSETQSNTSDSEESEDSSESGESSESSGSDAESSSESSDPECDAAAIYTFDLGPEGWHTGRADPKGSEVSWDWGKPQNYDIFGWATNLDGYHFRNESSYLASPVFSLRGCSGLNVSLAFSHWYSFVEVLNGPPEDGGIVEISTDGGQTWSWVEPSGAQYCEQPIQSTFPPVAGQRGFCNFIDNLNLRESYLDLSSYADQEASQVAIRFVFGSNDSIESYGWFIDQVEIRVE